MRPFIGDHESHFSVTGREDRTNEIGVKLIYLRVTYVPYHCQDNPQNDINEMEMTAFRYDYGRTYEKQLYV